MTIDGGVTVSADITLTIPEGKTLTVNGGINATGKTLTVEGKGTLNVTGASGGNGATGGIGGAVGNGIYGDVTVNSGGITVTGGTGGTGGAGGDGTGGNGIYGNVTVKSGGITVTGGAGGDGDDDDSTGAAVSGNITFASGASAEESDDNSDFNNISGSTSSKRYVKVSAPVTTSTYTLTIPATLSITKSGWNATDGISATGSLASGKKLTVTASSDGEFALVSQSDNTKKVTYKLAESGDASTTYANATEKTSWEFASLSDTAATQTMGVVVADYSAQPAGTYQDTVTFTAKVEDAAKVVDLSTISEESYSVTEDVIITGTPNSSDFTIFYSNNNYEVTLDNVNSAGNKTVRVNGAGYNMNIKLKGTSKLTMLGTSATLTIDEAEAGGTVIVVNSASSISGSSVIIDGGTVKAKCTSMQWAVSGSLTVNNGAVYLAGGSDFGENAVSGSITAGSGVTLYGWSGSAWTSSTSVQYVTTDNASGNPGDWEW